MTILYYEQIACDICGVSPSMLFVNGRPQYAVLARQFCMAYRVDVLNMNESESGARYNGRNHATVNHAKKTIKNYKETKDSRYKLYQKFLLSCKKHRDKVDDRDDFEDIELFAAKQVSEIGMKNYITKTHDLFNKLFINIKDDADETFIKTMIDTCHRKMHELKYLYE